MRGLIDGLPTPHPLEEFLPGMLQDDGFVRRFVAGLDSVLAPVLLDLDNLDAYLDPATAPADFVEWLSGWLGIALDENWPLQRQRSLVADAVELFRWRGTIRGLSAEVALYTGVVPEIEESGGCISSSVPNATLPGTGNPNLVVRVRTSDPAAVDHIDATRLNEIVSACKPAHVPHQVLIIGP